MPFRPHTLAYRVRRLTDAGILTVDQLATACGITRSTIDKILIGATPGRQTEHSIIRVLSYHARRNRHLKLELEEAIEPEPQAEAAEGLFEEMDAPAGQIEIKVRDGAGGRMALLQFRADVIDDELCADLERWHARKNPTHLKLAESSEQSSS